MSVCVCVLFIWVKRDVGLSVVWKGNWEFFSLTSNDFFCELKPQVKFQNPFMEKSNWIGQKEEGKASLIVDTCSACNTQGQRMHFAWTNVIVKFPIWFPTFMQIFLIMDMYWLACQLFHKIFYSFGIRKGKSFKKHKAVWETISAKAREKLQQVFQRPNLCEKQRSKDQTHWRSKIICFWFK